MASVSVKKVAIFGATGNLGTPIAKALASSPNIILTVISRPGSSFTSFNIPKGVPLIRTEYSLDALTTTLRGQDAVVSVVGFFGISTQKVMMDAAEAAGVKRFMLSEFGYGKLLTEKGLPEVGKVFEPRKEMTKYAEEKSAKNPEWQWCSIHIGYPLDWGLWKFTSLGFDVSARTCTIFDSGDEPFTGTTVEHMSTAVLSLVSPGKEDASTGWLIPTVNRQLSIRSLCTNQNKLLMAFESESKDSWVVSRNEKTANGLIEDGRAKLAQGDSGWAAMLLVGQLLQKGAGMGVIVTEEESDNALLGIQEITEKELVRRVFDYSNYN